MADHTAQGGAEDGAETLHVGNVGPEMTDGRLHALFAAAGRVVRAHVMADPRTQAPRGFGLVTMATHEDSESARRLLDGSAQDGRVLSVRPQPPRAPGWGGGNGRGGGNRSHGFGTGNGGSRW